jgi:hypothetical protein
MSTLALSEYLRASVTAVPIVDNSPQWFASTAYQRERGHRWLQPKSSLSG